MENRVTVSVATFIGSALFFVMVTGSIPVALTFMVLLACHEMGHYWACQRKEIEASVPIFTPFGAIIAIPGAPDAETEAYIGYGGPLVGTLASLVAIAVGIMFGSIGILQGAYWSLFLNLFNLIPWAPLDGGRICQPVTRHAWMLGAGLLAFTFFTLPMSPINLIVIYLIVTQGIQDIKMRNRLADELPSYYDVDDRTRTLYGAAYIGLAAFLGAMLWFYPQVVGFLASVLP